MSILGIALSKAAHRNKELPWTHIFSVTPSIVKDQVKAYEKSLTPCQWKKIMDDSAGGVE